MDNNMRLQFSSSIENISDINESFSSGLLRVCYTGLNRNGSFISKESIENAIPTMYNCPVVCNYDVESDTIGGHDVCCVRTDSGELRLINLTDAVGVIPMNAKYSWETVEDDSGNHEYFVTEVILWKRSPVYRKLSEDGIVSHSMEITVKNGFTQNDGVFVINDFIFTAFCLLGDGIEPCFESSSLQMFGKNGLHEQFTKMMEEFKLSFQKVNTSTEVDIHPQKYLTEGGKEQLEQKLELLAKFGLTVDRLDFDIESMSVEELEMELKKRIDDDDDDATGGDNAGGDNGGNDAGEPGTDEGGDEPEPNDETDTADAGAEAEFALLVDQLINSICESLGQVTRTTEWGEFSRYYYYDCDIDAHEVYCYDAEDWKLYGFSYSMNGDNVVIDFDSKKRKKFMIVDFDEGDKDVSFSSIFNAAVESSELNAKFAAERSDLEKKYNSATATIAELNREVDELRQYQQRVTAEERAAAEDAVFARFGDLNGVEAFDSLRANCSEMSIEDIEEKCFAIRGRVNTKVFSVEKPKQTRLPIDKRNMSNMSDEPYGGLFVEFPPSR